VEAEEDWRFDAKGGGTYALTVRWNADLWRRVGEVLGPKVMASLSGRAFPLRKAQWADGLKGLDGVEVLSLAESDTDTGLREISARVKFRALEDLLAWEVLARRTMRVASDEPDDDAGVARPSKEVAICNFYMEPIAHVPVLDRVGALLNALDRPPPPAEGAAAARDPGPLDRLGLESDAAELVWHMVKLPLAGARLRVQVHVLGEIIEEDGHLRLNRGRVLKREWDFAALRKGETKRTVHFAWRPRSLDVAPFAKQRGDRRSQTADGR